MSGEAWFTLAVVIGTVGLLTRNLVPASAALLGATVLLLVTGVIDAPQAFAGFANPAPITVAALYVLARAVEITGALDRVIARLLASPDDADEAADGRPPAGTRRRIARLAAPTAVASSVLNNTPIVAMVAPQVADWAARRGQSASPLLMPLSFAAILGGLVTAVGTSTNLVVSGLLEASGRPPMGMFEITMVGLPVMVAGLALLVLLGPRFLPYRQAALQTFTQAVREFSVAMRVSPDGPLDGSTVEAAGLRHLQGVFLARIDRGEEVIAPVDPDRRLAGDDVLTFVGKVDLIVDLQTTRGLVSTEDHHLEGLKDTRQRFYEAVLGQGSPMVGHTLKEVGFRGRYDAAVLAIHRAGERVDAKLGDVRLRTGDTLLLLADEAFYTRWRESPDFLLVAPIGGIPPARTRKAPVVGVIAAGIVLLAGAGVLPILQAALIAAFAIIATGALTMREARDAVDLDVIVVIAAAFGLGEAVAVTGLADRLAGLLVDGFAVFGILGALAGIILATIMLTELITNNAAAVLMFPIALATADAVGADARGFAIAVAVAASASFLTPIGYQTNTMVYGLGGYRFTDYVRLGFPLTVLVAAVSLLVIPLAWPF
ncbi:MAG TPA: SLC13 family permease [Egibacteraceae bacterium]|nr:SLC13 family permease [Egibacteraceae bacterium]